MTSMPTTPAVTPADAAYVDMVDALTLQIQATLNAARAAARAEALYTHNAGSVDRDALRIANTVADASAVLMWRTLFTTLSDLSEAAR
jgi:hypothetical protein